MPAKLLTKKFSLPPVDAGELDDDGLPVEASERKCSFRVLGDDNGRTSRLEVSGVGIGAHEARIRFDLDRPGHFDEIVTFTWDGDSHSFPLAFRPVAAIAVVDGSAEIRF